MEAYRQGRLVFIGVNGNLGLYRGEGYCFHATLIPETYELSEEKQEAVFVEAAPKGTKEARLKDAVFTLGSLADDITGFRKVPCPSMANYEQDKENDYSDFDEDEYFN